MAVPFWLLVKDEQPVLKVAATAIAMLNTANF